jgi:hypothetical protein
MSNSERQLILEAISAVNRLSGGITPFTDSGCQTANGGYVASLTEAVIDVSVSLGRIADALEDVASAIRERRDSDE